MQIPDIETLTEDEDFILRDVSEKWRKVQDTRGQEPDALVACANAAVGGLKFDWSNVYWVESPHDDGR